MNYKLWFGKIKMVNFVLFSFQCSEAVLVTSDEIDAVMSVANNMQKINRMSPSNNENGTTDKMNIFNVARVKKVELNDLPSLTKAGDDSGKFAKVDNFRTIFTNKMKTKKKERKTKISCYDKCFFFLL